MMIRNTSTHFTKTVYLLSGFQVFFMVENWRRLKATNVFTSFIVLEFC